MTASRFDAERAKSPDQLMLPGDELHWYAPVLYIVGERRAFGTDGPGTGRVYGSRAAPMGEPCWVVQQYRPLCDEDMARGAAYWIAECATEAEALQVCRDNRERLSGLTMGSKP